MLSANEFGQVRAFIAVAETLSFTRAAAQLGVSPSALSQMVRALEDRIGTRLLNRTTRSVSLTEAGDALLGRARPAALELDAALQQAGHEPDQPAGPVRIHCFRRAASLFLAPMLQAFAAAYPHVVLDITSDDLAADMVAGRYDAAIRIGEVIEQDMIAIRLGPDMRQVVVAARPTCRTTVNRQRRKTCSSIVAFAGAGRAVRSRSHGSSGRTDAGSP